MPGKKVAVAVANFLTRRTTHRFATVRTFNRVIGTLLLSSTALVLLSLAVRRPEN
jgi:hypothetical protein